METDLNKTISLLEQFPHNQLTYHLDLWYWANTYKISYVIFASHELKLFDLLEINPQTIPELINKLGLEENKLTIVLQLLMKIGILELQDTGYLSLTSKTKQQLPLVKLEAFLIRNRIYTSSIVNTLRGGQVLDSLTELMEIPGFRTVYYQAMQVSTRTLAPFIARLLRSSREKRILDIGGGDGSLASFLYSYFPESATFTVYDKFATNEFFDFSRVQFALEDILDFSTLQQYLLSHNLFILSNVLHLLSSSVQSDLLKLLYENMHVDGALIVYDQFTNSHEKDVNIQDFMQIDWLLLGTNFSSTGDAFKQEILKIGFRNITANTSKFYPGILFFIKK